MSQTFALTPDQMETLRAYADGKLGTREAIKRAGLHDYADLLIAMPKPADTPERAANVERARAILQPLLRRHD